MFCVNLKNHKHLDQAYKTFSPRLRALDLAHSTADVVSILHRNSADQGTQLKSCVLYSALFRQLSPWLGKNPQLIKKKISLADLDPSCPHAITWLKSSYIAFKCLFQNPQGSTTPRVLLLAPNLSTDKKTLQRFTLGNVDLFLFNPRCSDHQELSTIPMETSRAFSAIAPSTWLEIARHLDGGQRLNLSELFSLHASFFSNLQPVDAYEQHYFQLHDYISQCPNGPLSLKALPERFFVVHQSAYKADILSSAELRMSRGGCIGNLVYTTELVGDEGLNLGGHALGLLERKSILPAHYRDNLILAEVAKTANVWTNWIDKFGRGSLIAAARKKLLGELSTKQALQIDQNVQKLSLTEYAQIFPILQLSLCIAQFVKQHTSLSEPVTLQVFAAYKKLQATTVFSSLLNGIYFEIIKDYILFFQKDPESIKFRSMGSFNMGIQYRIFFQLCPALKASWDTTQFNPSLDTVQKVLEEHGFLCSKEQVTSFQKFFLERLAYYINFSLLEGSSSLADYTTMHHFEDLNAKAPNLASLVYYYSLKTHFRKTLFFKTFSDKMRAEYQRFYEERNITIAVKCGLARTEEIGLSKACRVRFLDFDLQQVSPTSVTLHPSRELDYLIIQGVSKTNGFTYRPPSSLQ